MNRYKPEMKGHRAFSVMMGLGLFAIPTWGQTTPGFDFEVDAGLDDGTNAIWEASPGTTAANLEFALDANVTWGAITTVTQFTHAYDFPGGFTGAGSEAGTGGGKLSRISEGPGECYSFADGPTPAGWDVQAVTIELWFRPDNITPPDGGYTLWEDGGGTGFGLFITDNQVITSQDTDQAVIAYNLNTDPDDLLLNADATAEFIQVVVTRTAPGITVMYVNGEQVGNSDDADGDWSGGDGFALGARGEANTGGRGNGDGTGVDGTTRSFDGQIALFRVYNQQILTPTEVRANFEELSGPDLVGPEVSSLTPVNGANDLFAGNDLVVAFDEDIQAGVGNITIKNLDAASSTVIPVGDGQITISGDTLTINPTVDLSFATNYAIQIDAGAITDQSPDGPNDFAGILDDSTWTFMTLPEDLTAPVVTGLSPADDSSAVAPNVDLVITFDEDIQAGTGNLTVKNLTDASDEVIPVGDAQVSISGNILTIMLAANLGGGKDYAVQIDPTAIENLSGLAYAGISDDTTWNFTTISSTTLTETGNWVGGNWDVGEPVAGVDAVIAPEVTATASGSVGAWSGDLTISSGGVLNVAGTGSEFIALDGAVNVAMDGSVLLNNFKSQTIASNFALSNGARFNITGNSAWNQDQIFAGNFTGTGGFTLKGGNHQGMRFTGTNTFSGGWSIQNQNQRFGVEFGATGSAGSGDVTVEGNADGTGQGAVIIVNAPDPFDPSATLTLNSNGFDNSSGGFGPFTRFLGTEIRIEMLEDATVGALFIDDVQQAAGSYTAASGSWISGSGTLTVLNGPGVDYDTWAAQFAPADLSDPDDDFDGDQRSNDYERLFGLDPTDPSSQNPYTVPLDPVAGTFSFTRRDNALTGLFTDIEISTNLENWSTDSGAVLLEGPVDGFGVETISVTLSPALLSNSALFIRLNQNDGTIFAENFDAPGPGLPAGWVANNATTVWDVGDVSTLPNLTDGDGTNCVGTNVVAGLYANEDATVALTSPPFAIPASGAVLSFRQYIDSDLTNGETGTIRLLDATDTEIVEGDFPIVDIDGIEVGWTDESVTLPPSASGQDVKLVFEFELTTTSSNQFYGFYVDDVNVKANP